jgi:hypothetical protein
MSKHKKQILLVALVVGSIAGCTSKKAGNAVEQTPPSPDSAVVRIPTPVDTAEVIPDPAADLGKKAEKPPEPKEQPREIAVFNGTVKGFGTQSFTFRLSDDQAVAVKLDSSRRAVFKLYRKTGELDETVTKDEQREWEGDLTAGEYEAKVFLPLKPSNGKRTESFRLRVIVQNRDSQN